MVRIEKVGLRKEHAAVRHPNIGTRRVAPAEATLAASERHAIRGWHLAAFVSGVEDGGVPDPARKECDASSIGQLVPCRHHFVRSAHLANEGIAPLLPCCLERHSERATRGYGENEWNRSYGAQLDKLSNAFWSARAREVIEQEGAVYINHFTARKARSPRRELLKCWDPIGESRGARGH